MELLSNIYEKNAPSENRDLKSKLQKLNMEKDEIVDSFFTKISQVRYKLASIGFVVDEEDLLQTTIDGLQSSWKTFLAAVNGR